METPRYVAAAERALGYPVGDSVSFVLSQVALRQWREALATSIASDTEIALYGVGDPDARRVERFVVPEQSCSAARCATSPTALVRLVRSANDSGAAVLCQAHTHPHARQAFLSGQDQRLLEHLVADLPPPTAERREAWVGVNGPRGELVGLMLRDRAGEGSLHAVRTRAMEGGEP